MDTSKFVESYSVTSVADLQSRIQGRVAQFGAGTFKAEGTSPDAITVFAVPNSSYSRSVVFSGLAAPRVASVSESPSLLRTGQYYLGPILSAVDSFEGQTS